MLPQIGQDWNHAKRYGLLPKSASAVVYQRRLIESRRSSRAPSNGLFVRNSKPNLEGRGLRGRGTPTVFDGFTGRGLPNQEVPRFGRFDTLRLFTVVGVVTE